MLKKLEVISWSQSEILQSKIKNMEEKNEQIHI